jgi:hypothetical protein
LRDVGPTYGPGLYVLDMDLLSFVSLSESNARVEAVDKVESAWTAFCAAQGSGENMKDRLARFMDLLPSTKTEGDIQTMSSLLNTLSKGILKKDK